MSEQAYPENRVYDLVTELLEERVSPQQITGTVETAIRDFKQRYSVCPACRETRLHTQLERRTYHPMSGMGQVKGERE